MPDQLPASVIQLVDPTRCKLQHGHPLYQQTVAVAHPCLPTLLPSSLNHMAIKATKEDGTRVGFLLAEGERKRRKQAAILRKEES